MERVFPTDELTKRERVERTLRHEPVDRVALHDQVSYNSAVISHYTGRAIDGFDYGVEDIACVVRQTLDMCFPIFPPIGTERVTSPDGFVQQNDNWTSWHVSRPFDTPEGARDWLIKRTDALRAGEFSAEVARAAYREQMASLQQLVGETIIFNWSFTGFASVFDTMGLELFVYFYHEYPQVFTDYLELSTSREIQRVAAIADPALSPLILIPEDFATKQGPIFPPQFLAREHFPFVTHLVEEWHRHDVHVIYHSDGNYKKVIPDLMACGVDGFYCLEPGVGMDIVELKNAWPQMVWAGGVDGVDLMERGTPEQVRAEVRRHIEATNARVTGGMFVGSSSEINPPIKVENYVAMVEAVAGT